MSCVTCEPKSTIRILSWDWLSCMPLRAGRRGGIDRNGRSETLCGGRGGRGQGRGKKPVNGDVWSHSLAHYPYPPLALGPLRCTHHSCRPKAREKRAGRTRMVHLANCDAAQLRA